MNAAQNVSSAGAETQTRPHTQPRASRDTFATEALVPGFVAPEMPADRSALAAAQADHDSRHWTSAHAGTIRPGLASFGRLTDRRVAGPEPVEMELHEATFR